MISLDGTIKMHRANAHIVQMYFLPCADAHVQCSHVDGGGEGFEVIFKNLWEEMTEPLILCSSYNVFKLPIMY
jgi:hypothetical protein